MSPSCLEIMSLKSSFQQEVSILQTDNDRMASYYSFLFDQSGNSLGIPYGYHNLVGAIIERNLVLLKFLNIVALKLHGPVLRRLG